MNEKELNLEKIARQIEKRERKSLKRSILYSFIPIVAALILLWITASQLAYFNKLKNQAKKELETANNKLTEIQDKIKKAKKELGEKEEQLRRSKLQTKTILDETLTKESLQREIDSKLKYDKAEVREIYSEDQGYVVVLFSGKEINRAVRALKMFRKRTLEDVRLYYAINDFYAVAIGIIVDKKLADAKVQEVKVFQADAYPYASWAFPYEIKLKLP